MSHPRSFSIFEEDNSSSNQNRSTEIAADSAYEANGEKERDTFTAAESRGVNALKIVVYVTLVFSAIGVGIGAFVFINDEKDVSLNTELGAISDLAALDLESYIHGISTQLSELSTALSSKYQSSDVGKWPNITLPFFDQRIQSNLDSELVFYTPIIATDPAEKAEWEEYGILNQGWIDEDLLHRGWDPITTQISEQIYPYADRSGNIMASFIMTPIWQFSPVPRNRSIVNLDASTHPVIGNVLQSYISGEARGSIMSESLNAAFFLDYVTIDEDQDPSTPRSFLSLPVFNSFNESADPFGYVFALMSWEKALDKAFEGADLQMIVDVQESCGPGFTFTIQNGKSRYVTTTQDLDMANPEYAFAYNLFDAACNYTVLIHPTKAALSEISTHVPILAFLIIALLFFLLIGLFNQYSRLVKQRQTKLLMTAKHSRAVVSSLFPEAVRTRLLADVQENEQKQHDTRRAFLQRGGSLNFTKMKEFLEDDREKNVMLQGKPIADFFPEATIMFADLVGFTAWSSMREPTQVFTLLESIYHGFDEIARRRRVFKVETIGDCYVAVAGLPEPCEDHAIVMARFASACRHKMKDIVKVLEVSLGPDTADLAMRIGLHSGPVTAGVLRGDKARFQLFGDTVNTTSRVETTGKRDKIHVSQETAEKLMKAGKVHWLNLREDKVTAKGKGELTTYWLDTTRTKKNRKDSMASSTMSNSEGALSAELVPPRPSGGEDGLTEKHCRLVDWITSELAALLRDVEVRRLASSSSAEDEDAMIALERQSLDNTMKKTPMEEVEEIMTLPKFDPSCEAFLNLSESEYGLPDIVVTELHHFVQSVATMYQENPFHNFEHASHVTMSVVKLLSRIVSPNIEFDGEDDASKLHDQTYGIASDPLTQFTVVLSALIHDLDHPGVPNAQLIKEKIYLADLYKNKSIAEQNSVDKSWILLIEGNYSNLRRAIYRHETEFKRFRQLLVNTVMATDIMDQELGARRKARWDKAFHETLEEDPKIAAKRKATIVIEHIIQASDIAHTMQHWHIYRKWNGRLFEEMQKAFDNGRSKTNPADSWYQGEMDFFDFYIIPLGKKLKDSGVFGVSGDEYLNYALQNRKEWALNGKTVVGNMLGDMRLENTSNHTSKPASFTVRTVSRTKSSDSLPGDNAKTKSSDPIKVPSVMSPFGESRRKAILRKNASFKMPSSIQLDGKLHESGSSMDSYDGLPIRLSVLIVEDEKIARKLFSRAIKLMAPKWKIQEAASGEQALEIIAKAEESFDLIFLDQFMGTDPDDLLGSDVVVKLREQGVESVICGMSANDVEALFAGAGADAFVFKPLPVRKDALIREMNRIIMHSSGDLGNW